MTKCTNAVILAAGLGSRLRGAHAGKPKGFIELDGEAIIRRSIRLLREAGVRHIVIVCGHLGEYYEELSKNFSGLETIRNDRYADSGSMYSLYCARAVTAPFLLLESDLVYEARALSSLQHLNQETAILLSGKTESGDEVYVETKEGCVRRMSKKPADLQSIGGELVGISKIGGPQFKAMLSYAEVWFQDKDLKLEYENCINGIIESGTPVAYHKIDRLLWTEIDDESHLHRAQTKIFPELRQTEIKRNILLNPGPATTTDQVKRSLVVPDICHREKEFCDLSTDVHRRLAEVVHGGSDYAAVTFAGSGTAAVEAVIGSVVPHDRKLLVIENGAYGKRMRQMAEALGIGTVVVACSWEETPAIEAIEEAFENHHGAISHLAVVHHETTSGLLNPVRQCAEISKRFGADVIVDAMSSYAGIPINIREWKVDYLVSSANKCLQAMAGISFAICNRNAVERASRVAPRSLYLSLVDQYRALARGGEARFTPPVQLFYALRTALDEYFAEGGEQRHVRYVACYEVLLAGMQRLGFKALLPERLHSKLLTTFLEPEDSDYNFDAMHDYLFERGFTIYPGKIAAKNTFRLANMGQIYPDDIRAFVATLEGYLR